MSFPCSSNAWHTYAMSYENNVIDSAYEDIFYSQENGLSSECTYIRCFRWLQFSDTSLRRIEFAASVTFTVRIRVALLRELHNESNVVTNGTHATNCRLMYCNCTVYGVRAASIWWIIVSIRNEHFIHLFILFVMNLAYGIWSKISYEPVVKHTSWIFLLLSAKFTYIRRWPQYRRYGSSHLRCLWFRSNHAIRQTYNRKQNTLC